jgi:3-keto-disaccharide hydrolase/Alpha-L-arabinofuranosidase 1 domain/Alpha-L-arabinofuranosidase C-terminal domain
MKSLLTLVIVTANLVFLTVNKVQGAEIVVDAGKVLHPVSRYLTGACIEDVNHEVYGGIYSQMIFGESFAEPAPQPPLKDFNVYGGRWTLMDDGGIRVVGSQGSKIVWDGPAFSNGEASVDVKLTEANGGNAGLILKVSDAGKGADAFNGYEVSLERPGTLVLGRHRQDWEPIRRVPCHVPVNQWVRLTVRTTAKTLEVLVNGKIVTKYDDSEHPLETGQVGLRSWQHDVQFRNFSITTDGVKHKIPFEFAANKHWEDGVSGMWRPFRHGSAEGKFSIQHQNPFSGQQCQQMTFSNGTGEIGIENRSLNRWGMNFVKDKLYQGHLWARAEKPTECFVALESKDGTKVYAEKSLAVKAGGWRCLDFTLDPNVADTDGQFAILLKQPGSVTLGYVFLEPGPWGRFKGLPVRKDVAEGLINEGITVLRYGGSMANAPEYRWKKMVGPRDRRPPYHGTWYPYSSNGWGIPDFLNFCEAAGFLGIPDFNINETPRDMADFIEYANGPTNTVWGARRATDGHPLPYHLKYLELGNEERVDDTYFKKFKPLAEAIWAKDPDIILIVGDFAYTRLIRDPFHFTGADSGITTLAAQQKILQLAKQHHREVWFDVHVGTDGPKPASSLKAAFSYDDALGRIANGTKYKVVVFELNANNHSQRRALANAQAINAAERDGRLPIVCSANCLQPDGQNDNGWNQGLLFLNPSQVWLQPPGYVTKMYSDNYEPEEVWSQVQDPANDLNVSAQRSQDGKTLVLKVVNLGKKVKPASLIIRGFAPNRPVAKVEELTGPLGAKNTAAAPDQITPTSKQWRPHFENAKTKYDFQPYSVTVIELN